MSLSAWRLSRHGGCTSWQQRHHRCGATQSSLMKPSRCSTRLRSRRATWSGSGFTRPMPCAATRLAGSHASKGHSLSTAVFTRHSTQTRPTSWAERTPSSVVMGIRRGATVLEECAQRGTKASLRGRARRGDGFAAGPVEPHAARSLSVGIGCRQFAAVRNTARSAPCGAPTVRSRVNELLTS